MLNLVLFCLGNVAGSQSSDTLSLSGSDTQNTQNTQNTQKVVAAKGVPCFRFTDAQKLELLDWLASELLVPLTRTRE